MLRRVFFCMLAVCFYFLSRTQTTPVPCTSPPSGPGCLCSTAGLLCTPDDLDGFTFSMSTATNNGGFAGGGDLCPNDPQFGVPNNVNWFSFIAWCTDLNLDVHISNCSQGGFNSFGIQLALFSGCSSGGTPSNDIDCLVESTCEGSAAAVVTPQSFSMSGLTIGNQYYFMLDGCAGSACDIMIDVVGTCGTGEIDPWSQPVMGPLTTCVGNTDTYTVEDLDGAVEFYYYLEGVLIDDGTELLSTDITWTTPGTYELCVDVSNLPCILESDDPPQNCITIMVCEEADAGMITVNPQPACPDEIVNISVTGNTSGPDHDQYIIITDNSGTIIEVVTGTAATFTHDECETFQVFSYNIKVGNPVPMVGQTFPGDFLPCSDACCDIEEDQITFEDNQPPTFDNPPPNTETYTCFTDLPAMMDLAWTDNCMGTGLVSGKESGSADLCNGGSITREWTVTDSCDNQAVHTQNITVAPMPPPVFLNPPADETVDCSMIPTTAPDLMYDNGEMGGCAVSGTVSPTTTGSADLCGGSIVNEWTHTDMCGRTITHSQTITVNPVPEPTFTSLPADMTVSCDAIPTSAPDLTYSNGETGACEIAGTVTPIESGSADLCGGSIVYTWEVTDPCGRQISHTQTITVDPVPPATFASPPADMTVSCDAIPTSAPDLTYSNGETGACEIAGTVSATQSGTGDMCGGSIVFTWDFTDQCGRNINHIQTITIDPMPPAMFINPPADVTVTCSNQPTSSPDLSYENGVTGACEISGTVAPVVQDNSSECGGNIVNTWEFTDPCNRVITHTQTITIDPAPQASFINPPTDITVDCDAIPTSAPDLDYTNSETGACEISGTIAAQQSGNPTPCGGSFQFQWIFTDDCGRQIQHIQTITINPSAPPVFDPAPPDITVDCDMVPGSGVPLDYTNGESGFCEISGTAFSTRVGVSDECGGTLVDNWTFTDGCGRTITAFRNVTVNPAPPAMFINPPSDVTVDCDQAESVGTTLGYSNNEPGDCLIEGQEDAIISSNYDACGGLIVYTWTFTDDCNRTITHTQNITVNPAIDPYFIDPPMDLTLDCGGSYTPPQTIEVSNEQVGNCLIMDDAILVSSSPSGNTTTYVWEYTNPCNGSVLTHSQDVFDLAQPDIVVSPLNIFVCEGDFYDLSTITVTDNNGTNPTITFHEFLPPNSFNEIGPLFEVLGNTSIYVYAINSDGCEDSEEILAYTSEPYLAGEDVEVELCKDGSTIDLNVYLSSDASNNGFWVDAESTGIDVTNSTAVNINNTNPGVYNLYYITEENEECAGDTAILTLTILDEIDYEILDISCSSDNLSYSVQVLTNGNPITSSTGTINTIDANNVEIVDIPIGDQIEITLGDSSSECSVVRVINPPNCDCPDIPEPTGTPDYKICSDQLPITMTVMVESGLTANWYDSQSSMTPLVTGMLNFDHTNPMPGLYSYYVEAIDPVTGCVSQNRLKIDVEVVALPVLESVTSSLCDDNTDGFVAFDLETIKTMVNPNPNISMEFYGSMADATSGNNALSSPYTNTSNNQVIYVVGTNSNDCQAMTTVTLNVLPKPDFDINAIDESCLGEEDGSFEIINVTSNGPVELSVNGGSFDSKLKIDSLSPGTYTIRVRDEEGCETDSIVEILEGLQLSEVEFTLECDNKGTLTDASDDEYVLTFNYSNNKGNSGTFEVFIDGISIGNFGFNQTHQHTLDADESNKTVLIQSVEGCEIEKPIGPLNPCSTTCEISFDEVIYECDNNGTENDPTDDFYNVSITVSSINGSVGNTYNLLVDGVLRGVGTYNTPYDFSVNSSSSNVLLTVQDSDDSQCQSIYTLTDLIPCSDGCAVFLNILEENCFNNGTILDKTDDYYEIVFIADAINTGSNTFVLSIDGVAGNTYNYGDTIRIEILADGNIHNLTAEDTARPECTITVDTRALINCSTDCQIDVEILDKVCDNNGTNDIDSDDLFRVTVRFSGGKGNGWSIPILGVQGNYGEQIELGPFLISDGTQSITVEDVDLGECILEFDVDPTSPCSGCIQTMSIMADGEINCSNPEVNLSASVSEPGEYEWSYQGGFVSDQLNATAGSEGYYVFTAIFSDGCVLEDSVFVESDDDIPTANAGPDGVLNCSIDTFILDGSLSSQGGNLRYEWTDALGNVISMNMILTVDQPGEYFLQVFDDANNCASAKDKVLVEEFLDQPSSAIYANPGDQFDCIIAEIILSTDNEPNVSYSWITPEVMFDDVPTISINQIGEYILIATNTQSLCADTSSIEILSFQEYPIIELSADEDLECDNNEVFISTLGSQNGASITYSWYDIDGNFISNEENGLPVQEPGLYVLVLEDSENGCTNSDTIEIKSNVTEVGIEIETVIEVVKGEKVVLRPQLSIPEEDIATIVWTPSTNLSCVDCLEPTVTVKDETITYTVVVTDIYGCIGQASITIRAKIDEVINVPNIIYPTSKGGNDKFIVFTNDENLEVDQVIIYDRWGNKVYASNQVKPNSAEFTWDGKLNGKDVVPGVYVYMVKARTGFGESVVLSGDLTVIK